MVKVLSFERSADLPAWYLLKLDRKEHPELLVHQNWVSEFGMLKPGDEVVAEGTHIHYSNVETPCAIRLERIPKAAIEA